MLTERAPAKINLYLHVTGKSADGYHTLDSLAVFAKDDSACDRVEIKKGSALTLSITGPEAGPLQNESAENNLIHRALTKLGAALGRAPHFDVTLLKTLPVASGIGGGSADAAAALRGAALLWGLASDHPALLKAAAQTGSDVSACLSSRSCYLGGAGDKLEFVENLPAAALLLANPHIPLPTAEVFRARRGTFSPEARLDPMPMDTDGLAEALNLRRNDLEEPAKKLCDAIADVLDTLMTQPGCLLARLSGSGATCFGIFENRATAEKARATIEREIREWWLAVTEVGG